MSNELMIAELDSSHSVVKLSGWVTRVHNLGGVVFIGLRDSTGMIQLVVSENKTIEGLKRARHLKPMDFIKVKGVLRWNAKAPEIEAQILELVSRSLRAKAGRHLEMRRTEYWAIMRIRDKVTQGLETYLRDRGFISSPPPAILPLNKNSGFQLDFYNRSATLSQSGALYMAALALALGRVFSIHPIFRSEKSKTRRHLAEFWMLELEEVQLDFEELLNLVENLIKSVVSHVLRNCIDELQLLERDIDFLSNISYESFPRMEYGEVITRLQAEGHDMQWGLGLGKHEKVVSGWFKKPLFVVKFPRSIGSWTAQPEDSNVSLSVNLLAPEGYGEILQGCQRNADPDFLNRKFNAAGVDLGWYADIHRHGGLIHSGAGLGIERLCQWICGADNIRDVIPFPRSIKDFYP